MQRFQRIQNSTSWEKEWLWTSATRTEGSKAGYNTWGSEVWSCPSSLLPPLRSDPGGDEGWVLRQSAARQQSKEQRQEAQATPPTLTGSKLRASSSWPMGNFLPGVDVRSFHIRLDLEVLNARRKIPLFLFWAWSGKNIGSFSDFTQWGREKQV